MLIRNPNKWPLCVQNYGYHPRAPWHTIRLDYWYFSPNKNKSHRNMPPITKTKTEIEPHNCSSFNDHFSKPSAHACDLKHMLIRLKCAAITSLACALGCYPRFENLFRENQLYSRLLWVPFGRRCGSHRRCRQSTNEDCLNREDFQKNHSISFALRMERVDCTLGVIPSRRVT